MASNPTPDDDDVLIALAEDLADGCHLHETAIGIKQQTETVMRATLLTAKNALMEVGATKAALTALDQLLATRDAEGKVVLKNCRLRLAKLYGNFFNANWQTAGFPNQSTAIPDNADQRFTLLGALKLYFTAHPEAESDQAEATAAICEAAHQAISDARHAVNAAEATHTTARTTTLPAAIRTLRKRVRGLIVELGTLIADDDPRWAAFGLNIPAEPAVPEPIEDLTLSALGSARVFVQWPYASRMTGTRLMARRIGVDDEFASIGTISGLEKLLTAQTVGQTIEMFAVAFNDGGDAPPSPTRSVVVA